MAIKASIKKIKKVKKTEGETPFPKLMVSTHTGKMVFFESPQVGVVLASKGQGSYNVGDKGFSWSMNNFVDYIVGGDKPEEEEKGLPFPKLMIAKDGNEIIHFTKNEVGVVVYVREDSNLGLYYAGTAWDMNYFKDFKGKLTLKNE
jgi:hypothetical protein